MSTQWCQSAGCGGTIDQGFCDRCGLAPAGVPTDGASRAIAPALPSQTWATRAASSVTASLSTATALTSSTGRGGTGRSTTRRHLGLGMVNVPGLPELSPELIVMTDPKVPDHKRFCGNPNCHDEQGNPTPLNRRLSGHCPSCGTFYSFVPTLSRGDVVCEQYEVKGCLAYGGLGWIYLARDATLNRWVVLKGLLNSADESAAAAAVAERQFLASVKHANIVGIYNFVKRGAEGFIVMEYVGGTTLKEVRKSRGPLPPAEAIAYVHRILGAFSYLHDRGLVYCDFKPDNFMIEGEPPDVKLIDMGGVRMLADTAGDIYGTRGYSAPEIAEGPTVASDLYTVGRTLAVLLMEFRFQSFFEHTLPAPEDQPLLAKHESLYRFLLRATAPRPDLRFASADEMAEQLAGVLREVVVVETGQPPARPAESTLFGGEPPIPADADITQANPRFLPEPRIDPDDSGAGEVLAVAAVTDPAQRAAMLQAAKKKWPNSIDIPLRMAADAARAGQFHAAEATLSGLEKSCAGDWRLTWWRGVSRLHQLHHAAAHGLFDALCSTHPGEAPHKVALAMAAEALGDHAAATRLYDLASRSDPSLATAAFGLARCLSHAGDRHGAAAAYCRVPSTSSLYLKAQAARARVLAGSRPAPPGADDLCQAAQVIEAMPLEGIELARLRRGVGQRAGGPDRPQCDRRQRPPTFRPAARRTIHPFRPGRSAPPGGQARAATRSTARADR